jgi:hypothetical protein
MTARTAPAPSARPAHRCLAEAVSRPGRPRAAARHLTDSKTQTHR